MIGTQEFTEQNVEHLVMLCISREDAIDCLRANQDNIEKAAEYFYSGGLERDRQNKKKDSTWDEGAFHRENWETADSPTIPPGLGWDSGAANNNNNNLNNNNNNNNSFEINVIDAHPPGARSRAPSPVGPTFGPQQPTGREFIDNDLQQAIKLSMEDDRSRSPGYNYGPQEHGVVGNRASPANGSTNFRPAVQPHYDPGRWAIDVHNAQRLNEVELPSPQLRKREADHPAFLKPSTKHPFLPGFLTIMHSIPAGRNAFLCTAAGIFEEYGNNKDWWNGEEIDGDKSRIEMLHRKMQESSMADERDENPALPITIEREVFYGLQRYMAFLDLTERAYGSIDGLIKSHHSADSIDGMSQFGGTWFNIIRDFGKESEAFRQASGIVSHACQISDGYKDETSFTILRNTIQNLPYNRSLYQALDSIFWGDIPEESERFLTKTGDVITITLERKADSPNTQSFLFDIPRELQMQRYGKEMRNHMALLRKTQRELEARIRDVERRARIVQLIPKNSVYDQDRDARKYLEASLDYFERVDPDPVQVSNLKRVIEQIDEKLNIFSETKEQLETSLIEALSAYTTTEEMPEGAKPHILVGAIVNPYTYYFLIDYKDPELFWEVKFTEPPSQTKGYLPPANAYTENYSLRKATIDEVLSAVQNTKYNTALLCYASEDAYTVPPLPVPQELESFARQDNINFYKELHPPPTTSDFSPVSSAADINTVLSPMPRHSSSSLIRQLTPDSTPGSSTTGLIPIININETLPSYSDVVTDTYSASKKPPPSPVDTSMREPSIDRALEESDMNDGSWEANALNLNEGGVSLIQKEPSRGPGAEMKEVRSNLSPIKAAFGENRAWKGSNSGNSEEDRAGSTLWSDDIKD